MVNHLGGMDDPRRCVCMEGRGETVSKCYVQCGGRGKPFREFALVSAISIYSPLLGPQLFWEDSDRFPEVISSVGKTQNE